MSQTYPVITHETRKSTATGYCGYYDDRPEHSSHALVPAIWAEYSTGDGCEVSTALDMATYLRMLLNHGQGPSSRLVSEASFNMMTLDGIWTGGDFYGYGLATYPADDRVYIGHGGGNAGFRSAIVVDLDAGLGVVFLLNRMGETDPVVDAAQHALTVIRAEYLGEKLPSSPPPLCPSAISNASDYAGTFYDGEHALKLVAQDGKLLLEYESTKIVLERRSADSFYVDHPDFALFLLDFTRDGADVSEAFHGNNWFTKKRTSKVFSVPEAWSAYLGHYRARNPELSNFRIVLRKGALALVIPWGTSAELVPLDDGSFRIGVDPCSPERIHFDALVENQTLRATYSGCPYHRVFTP